MLTQPIVTHYGGGLPGSTLLRPGDVFRLGGVRYIVATTGECNAHCLPLDRKAHQVADRVTGETASFTSAGRAVKVATEMDPASVLERRGGDGLNNFLSSSPDDRRTDNQTDGELKEKNSMAKVKKETVEKSTGQLGGLYGFAVTAVIRAMGASGFTSGQIKTALTANKVKAADATISIQKSQGKNGKGAAPAPLTKAQITELRAVAGPAEVEEEPTKKTKATKTSKAKTTGKAARAEEKGVTAATASASGAYNNNPA